MSMPRPVKPFGKSPSAWARPSPHLCYTPEPGYRADGNCRACMVEIEGERVLAASCVRQPTDAMVVHSQSERAARSRAMVMELLVADQPARESAHDPNSELWAWAEEMGQTTSRFPAKQTPAPDASHPAMAINLDACIHCTRCVARVPRGSGQRRHRHGEPGFGQQDRVRFRRSYGARAAASPAASACRPARPAP